MESDQIIEVINEIRSFYNAHGNPDLVKKYSRFFVEGYDAYGVDQKVIEKQRLIWFVKFQTKLGFNDFLQLGDLLVAGGKYEEVFLGFWFIKQFEKQFTKATFIRLSSWLENGICNWAQTDVFSGDIISPFLINKIVDMDALTEWRYSSSKWMRRSATVSLIKPSQGGQSVKAILDFIAPLMNDTEKVVHQGLGWLLRETWKLHPQEVEAFLLEWKDTCPRLIIQYATEKMKAEQKSRYKRLKPKKET
jgi:3-methyladenine DNA glycosylase AlkD